MEEIQDWPRVRDETRPEVEWLKSTKGPTPKTKPVDGYAVIIGPPGHYVKVKTLGEIDGIIEDGSTP